MFCNICKDKKIIISHESLYGYERVLRSHAFSNFPRLHLFGQVDAAQVVSYRMRAIRLLLVAKKVKYAVECESRVFKFKALFRTLELAQRNWKYEMKTFHSFQVNERNKNASRFADILGLNISRKRPQTE
jgi:hypothetical protein